MSAMTPITDAVLLRVLKACADASPLYPTQFTSANGLDRPTLDGALDRLRLLGLVEMTDWAQGKGQGYRVTPAGAGALQKGRIAAAPPPAEEAAPARETTWDRGEQVRSAFIDPSPPVVALALLFANLAAFVVGIGLAWRAGVSLDEYLLGKGLAVSQLYVDYGGLWPYRVVTVHEYWRLLSHLFLHGGFVHLAFNSMALFVLGPRLETLWGPKRFLVLYLISGWSAGCAVVLSGENAVTIGASGAICGLFASLAISLWLNREHLPDELRAGWQRIIGQNLLLIVIISIMPNVSWEGHLGGAIGGALVSIPLHYLARGPLPRRLMALLGVVAIPAVALAIALGPSHWPMLTARWRYSGPIAELDAWVAEQTEHFILPALSHDAAGWNENTDLRDAARAAADEAQAKLPEFIAKLQVAAAENESPLRMELLRTAAYFSACNGLFESLKRFADHPETWDAGRRALRQRYRLAMQLRRPMQSNRFMPALAPRELVEPAEPAPRPPPNTA
jgi:membrane associated rhomboid family serine protease